MFCYCGVSPAGRWQLGLLPGGVGEALSSDAVCGAGTALLPRKGLTTQIHQI